MFYIESEIRFSKWDFTLKVKFSMEGIVWYWKLDLTLKMRFCIKSDI